MMENFNAPDWASEKQAEGMALFALIFADYEHHFDVSFKQSENDDSNHRFIASVKWRYGFDSKNQQEQRTHDFVVGWNVQETWSAANEKLSEWQFVFGDDDDATRTLNAEYAFTDITFGMIGITTGIIDRKNKWTIDFSPENFYGIPHNDVLNDDQRELVLARIKGSIDWETGLSYETFRQAIASFIEERLEFKTDDYGIVRYDADQYKWLNEEGKAFMLCWENNGDDIDPDEGLTFISLMDDPNRFEPESAIKGNWQRTSFKNK
jgi:hypothetical protein